MKSYVGWNTYDLLGIFLNCFEQLVIVLHKGVVIPFIAWVFLIRLRFGNETNFKQYSYGSVSMKKNPLPPVVQKSRITFLHGPI